MKIRWKDYAIATGGVLAAGAAAIGILTGLRDLSVLAPASPPVQTKSVDGCDDGCQRERANARARAEQTRIEADLIRASFETCPPLSSAQSDRILSLVAEKTITADEATALTRSLTCRLFSKDARISSDEYVASQYDENGLPVGLVNLMNSDNGAVRRAFVRAIRADFSQSSIDELSLAVDKTLIPLDELPPETGGTLSPEEAGLEDLLLSTGIETTVCRNWGDVCEPGMVGYEERNSE